MIYNASIIIFNLFSWHYVKKTDHMSEERKKEANDDYDYDCNSYDSDNDSGLFKLKSRIMNWAKSTHYMLRLK